MAATSVTLAASHDLRLNVTPPPSPGLHDQGEAGGGPIHRSRCRETWTGHRAGRCNTDTSSTTGNSLPRFSTPLPWRSACGAHHAVMASSGGSFTARLNGSVGYVILAMFGVILSLIFKDLPTAILVTVVLAAVGIVLLCLQAAHTGLPAWLANPVRHTATAVGALVVVVVAVAWAGPRFLPTTVSIDTDDIDGNLGDGPFTFEGTASHLGAGQTVWLFLRETTGRTKEDEENFDWGSVRPIYGPCGPDSDGDWSCGEVRTNDAGTYAVVAVALNPAQSLAMTQHFSEVYSDPSKCEPGTDPSEGCFFPVSIPSSLPHSEFRYITIANT